MFPYRPVEADRFATVTALLERQLCLKYIAPASRIDPHTTVHNFLKVETQLLGDEKIVHKR